MAEPKLHPKSVRATPRDEPSVGERHSGIKDDAGVIRSRRQAMNMHSAISNAAVRENIDLAQDFESSLAHYRELRSISDATDTEAAEADDRMDAYCDAMDHLIRDIPAPDIGAVVTKLELLGERLDGFLYIDASTEAVMGDLKRLAAVEISNKPSLIKQLHQRYEDIWDAHHRVDVEQQRKDESGAVESENLTKYYACERAMAELGRESLLVQKLILRQVPSTDEEIAIQAMHLACLYEAEQPLSRGERQAIELGICHVFDYLMREGRADMERLGRQATATTMIAWDHCRYREGKFDD